MSDARTSKERNPLYLNLEILDDIVRFAYTQGFHELGYDIVAEVRGQIREIERSSPETIAEWRPMETAPRDGREVILKVERRAGIPGRCLVGHYMPGGHCIQDHPPIDEGWFFWTGHLFDREAKPIAWMPLPPESPVKSEGEPK